MSLADDIVNAFKGKFVLKSNMVSSINMTSPSADKIVSEEALASIINNEGD